MSQDAVGADEDEVALSDVAEPEEVINGLLFELVRPGWSKLAHMDGIADQPWLREPIAIEEAGRQHRSLAWRLDDARIERLQVHRCASTRALLDEFERFAGASEMSSPGTGPRGSISVRSATKRSHRLLYQ